MRLTCSFRTALAALSGAFFLSAGASVGAFEGQGHIRVPLTCDPVR